MNDDSRSDRTELTRRQFAALLTASVMQQTRKEAVTAGATEDRTPRVAIVLSSFAGSEDHDGTPLPGLKNPRPPDAELNDSEIDAMLAKALELGNTRRGGLEKIIGREDWVVIKPTIPSHPGMRSHQRGTATDIRLVRSLIQWLVSHRCGARFTIAEGAAAWDSGARAGWEARWPEVGNLSYQDLIEELQRKHAGLEFDLVDLDSDKAIEMPLLSRAAARSNREGRYYVAQTVQQCDRLISLVPLKFGPDPGLSPALANHLAIAPASHYGKDKDRLRQLGELHEIAVDLFSLRPADYAIVGGCWVWGKEGVRRHNLLLAGTSAVAVDAVAAAVMGIAPSAVPCLRLAEEKGLGLVELEGIWTRGNSVEEAGPR